MDYRHFDDLTRSLAAALTRRGILAGLASGVVAASPLVMSEFTTAKKKKKKKKKKPSALAKSCAATCGPGCTTCYERPNGAIFCGGAASADCNKPCTTDTDCAGTPGAVCTKSFTELSNGKTFDWGCPAACTNALPCAS
jgi:hypothetical protein